MYFNDKILIGKSNNEDVYLLPKMANRHGLITGASGSGKTITLKVLAESFSDARVPVFLVDIKGDLAGMVNPGNMDTIKDRIASMNVDGFTCKNYKTCFWDVYGEHGHPVRTTVKEIGAPLLSRMLNLTEAQEGNLAVIFKIAEDEELVLNDLNDLKITLNYIGERRKDYSLAYGNITTQSIATIQRNILILEQEGGDLFFGKPSFNIKDFIRFDANTGESFINVLHAVKLFQNPKLYATFMLWLLTSLYNELPEVGDVDKPKIVFFFDEAHLVFSEMPAHLIKEITRIVKLIRSKGIGLYFISQTPSDIPEEILAQLGNRIQHVLRSYTPNDEKIIKACANSFRKNPEFDTEETIKSLATGEALVSVQNEKGEPTIVVKTKILPPQSQMGTIAEAEYTKAIQTSPYYGKYDTLVNEESAEERIMQIIEEEEAEAEELLKEEEKNKEKTKTTTKKKTSARSKKGYVSKKTDRLVNRTVSAVGTRLGNKIFKSLFK